MRLLFITDSLALARDKPEQLKVDETYPELLKKELSFIEVQQLSIGGATIYDLYNAAKYYTSFNPDLVVIQSGIVDCAPRALSKFERQVLNRIPLLGKWILNAVSRNPVRFRKSRKITYTKPHDFEKWLKRMNKLFADAQIMHIAIMPSSIDYEAKLPGVSKNIEKYNSLINANSNSVIGNTGVWRALHGIGLCI